MPLGIEYHSSWCRNFGLQCVIVALAGSEPIGDKLALELSEGMKMAVEIIS